MFIGYLRVSTERQAASGLGLEAQRAAIELYAEQQGIVIGKTFIETESGKAKVRPQLNAALALCRKNKATLLIAKLDRLARNVAFVAALMETGVEFVAVDAPFANRLMIHVLSAVAEWEREQISDRTKAALAAAKARGVVLGRNGHALGQARKRASDCFALNLKPVITEARQSGLSSLRQLAEHLNATKIAAPNGGLWHATTVQRVLARIELT